MTFEAPARFAVFSDIHANLPALENFLQYADGAFYEALVCLGDIVGYGAHPNECCETVRKREIPAVMGNHDRVALTLENAESFNEIARRAIRWTHEQLTEDNAEYLKHRPYRIVSGDYTFVHASPREPERWHYILTHSDAELSFQAFDTKMCFVGHSHQPFAVEYENGMIRNMDPDELTIRDECRYLINVGSIGQPRDRNPDSCWVEVDREQRILRFRRLGYPVRRAQDAIEHAGLPTELAYRLTMGL